MMLLASVGGNRVPVIAQLVAADGDAVRDLIHRCNVCGPCTTPDAELWRACPVCGQAEWLRTAGPCRRCVLKHRLDALLAGPSGAVAPRLTAARPDCLRIFRTPLDGGEGAGRAASAPVIARAARRVTGRWRRRDRRRRGRRGMRRMRAWMSVYRLQHRTSRKRHWPAFSCPARNRRVEKIGAYWSGRPRVARMSDQQDPGPNPDGRTPGLPQPRQGAHGRRLTAGKWWHRFRESPLLPGSVVVLIVGIAAGLFASSYTYAFANPMPRDIPTAFVSVSGHPRQARAFVGGMERALDSSLDLHRYRTFAQAKQGIEAQRVFAVLRVGRPGWVEVDVASAAGASVAQVIARAAPKVGRAVGVQVRMRDLKPLAPGDPRGLATFYVSLAAVIIGFLGALQLAVHARALNPAERVGFTALYAVLGGFVIVALVSWALGAVPLPFGPSWGILTLTMFTSGMVFTMFNTLVGRWAIIPTWGLMVLVGNPSSGGAVSWPLLPSVLGAIGRWLPPGASVNAQHTAIYFPGFPHVQPYLVLAAWAVASCAIFWFWPHRHPHGRPRPPAHAEG